MEEEDVELNLITQLATPEIKNHLQLEFHHFQALIHRWFSLQESQGSRNIWTSLEVNPRQNFLDPT